MLEQQLRAPHPLPVIDTEAVHGPNRGVARRFVRTRLANPAKCDRFHRRRARAGRERHLQMPSLQDAHIEHAKFQEENLEAFHVATTQVTLARDSRFLSHSISTGARLARHNINLVMTGQGVDCVMNGLYAFGGKQLVDHHTVADHAQPHCGSHEYYHGILGGSSRGVFNGKIFVRKDAQKTDAKQTSRNLLLTDTATVNAKPQLEILADDVKCTHGATVGQMNDEALFYCRTRGIGEVDARRLLTHAFASEIVNRITVEPVREHLEQVLWARLEELIEKK